MRCATDVLWTRRPYLDVAVRIRRRDRGVHRRRALGTGRGRRFGFVLLHERGAPLLALHDAHRAAARRVRALAARGVDVHAGWTPSISLAGRCDRADVSAGTADPHGGGAMGSRGPAGPAAAPGARRVGDGCFSGPD